MRFHKRTSATTFVVASLAAAAFAAPAGASSPKPVAHASAFISTSYCESSLRGQTGQAPDNDIRYIWDLLQNGFGYNITSSSANPYGWGSQNNLTWNTQWRFYYVNFGGGTKYANFKCWWGSDGAYHDDFYG